MKTRDFCARVARNTDASQEDVFRIFLACVQHGKEIIAQGDEWRLPGLGKVYCSELPPRTLDSTGRLVRDLDSWETAPAPKKKVRCKFSAFKSALEATSDEDAE